MVASTVTDYWRLRALPLFSYFIPATVERCAQCSGLLLARYVVQCSVVPGSSSSHFGDHWLPHCRPAHTRRIPTTCNSQAYASFPTQEQTLTAYNEMTAQYGTWYRQPSASKALALCGIVHALQLFSHTKKLATSVIFQSEFCDKKVGHHFAYSHSFSI